MSEESSLRSQQKRRVVLAGLTVMLVLLASIGLVPFDRGASAAVEGQEYAQAWEKEPAASAGISIDYPEDGSIFPPGITPPTFIWRDAAATSWRINISFANKAPALQFRTNGERMHVGAIDPECVAESNKPPQLDSAAGGILDLDPRSCHLVGHSTPFHRPARHGHHYRLSQ